MKHFTNNLKDKYNEMKLGDKVNLLKFVGGTSSYDNYKFTECSAIKTDSGLLCEDHMTINKDYIINNDITSILLPSDKGQYKDWINGVIKELRATCNKVFINFDTEQDPILSIIRNDRTQSFTITYTLKNSSNPISIPGGESSL